jgi:hypothetical protein
VGAPIEDSLDLGFWCLEIEVPRHFLESDFVCQEFSLDNPVALQSQV